MMTALTLGSPTSRAPPPPNVVTRLSADQPQPQPQPYRIELPTLANSTPPPQIPLPCNHQFALLQDFLLSPPSSPLVFSDILNQLPLSSVTPAAAAGPSNHHRQPRGRQKSILPLRVGKKNPVPAPYPWATTRRATVHSMAYLVQRGILDIQGQVQCRRCEEEYEMGFDLKAKFDKLKTFIAENKSDMNDRAPACWTNPVFPACKLCKQENSVRPVIAKKKKSINWLFLLLGQLLGCCTLEQLKYFCKYTRNHRTGAKDRVLYLTYLALCKQLDPTGPFDPLSR